MNVAKAKGKSKAENNLDFYPRKSKESLIQHRTYDENEKSYNKENNCINQKRASNNVYGR